MKKHARRAHSGRLTTSYGESWQVIPVTGRDQMKIKKGCSIKRPTFLFGKSLLIQCPFKRRIIDAVEDFSQLSATLLPSWTTTFKNRYSTWMSSNACFLSRPSNNDEIIRTRNIYVRKTFLHNPVEQLQQLHNPTEQCRILIVGQDIRILMKWIMLKRAIKRILVREESKLGRRTRSCP